MQYYLGASLLTLLGLAGSLRCSQVNGGADARSSRPRPRLEVHPRIEEWSHNAGKKLVLHKRNEPLNMTCDVVYRNGAKDDRAPLDYTVDWKVPHRVDDDLKIERGQSRNTAWIWFERLSETDAGDYACNAVPLSDERSALTVSFHLMVEHAPRYCGSEWFKCHSKNCIMERYVCDGKRDCENGEDESPAAGCGPDPCLGKIVCEDRCIPPEWCCDHRNCTGTFGLRPWPHENNEISYVQTAFYTVIGCAMAFMFIVTILVIAICKVQIKRAMNSRCSQQNRNPCARRPVPLYDLDVYFNRTAEVNYPGGVSIMYNINSGVQFVGRPAEPPPYSEVVAEPPREGPPPPYVSCENLIVRQQNPLFDESADRVDSAEFAVGNASAPLAIEPSLKDEDVARPDSDIRGSNSVSSQIPGPQVAATRSSASQLFAFNTVDAPTVRLLDASASRVSPPNFQLEYVETDALLAESSAGNPAIRPATTKATARKPYSRRALIKSRWLNNDRTDRNPEKHWYRQRVEKTAMERESRSREASSSLSDSTNEGVFLDTDQQQQQQQQQRGTTSAEANGSGEFVDAATTSFRDTGNERPANETTLTDYETTEMRVSHDDHDDGDESNLEPHARRSSQANTDKCFPRGINRQSSSSSKDLGESSAGASTGTIDSANSSLVLPLRESFIGVQRDS